jgi:hypothetical protein
VLARSAGISLERGAESTVRVSSQTADRGLGG